MTERCDIDNVRICRMDADSRDRLSIFQAGVLPSLARIGGLVNSVALYGATAQLGFTHSDINDVWARFGNRNCSHRRAMDLAIGHRRPGGAAIGGLPQAPASRAEVILERPCYASRYRLRSATAVRPNITPTQAVDRGQLRRGSA